MVLIELYTKDQCPLCETAKNKLNENNVPFIERVIGKDVTRDEVLTKFPKARVAPIIVVDGVQIKSVESFQLLLEG